MDAMTPLDSLFLRLEDRHTSLHIASVAIFEGPTPLYTDVAALVARKMTRIPRYRQRVRELPFGLGRPAWVDDPDFRLDYHVRRTALPRPGGPGQLDALVGRLMSQHLDRDKPLWECWIIEGLSGGRWAMVNKVHHCMVDGIAGTDLLGALLDDSPTPADDQPDDDVLATNLAARASGPVTALLDGALSRLRNPARLASETVNVARLATHTANLARGLTRFASLARPATASSLTGELGAARAWTGLRLSLADVQAVRAALGGTVNDVLLAAIARGFRDLLLARGEQPAAHTLRTLVPVSVRGVGERGRMDNRVSALVAELPVDVGDPLDRLRTVRHRMRALKGSGERQTGELLSDVAGLIPPALLAATLSAAFHIPQRFVVTVATNVPGPDRALYAAGRRMIELYPYVPIADRLRIGVAVLSYLDGLYVGVTVDRDSTPDVAVLTAGIEDEILDLLEIASGCPPASAPAAGGTSGTSVRD